MEETMVKGAEVAAENPAVASGVAEVLSKVKAPSGKVGDAILGLTIVGVIAILVEHGIKWTWKQVMKLWKQFKDKKATKQEIVEAAAAMQNEDEEESE